MYCIVMPCTVPFDPYGRTSLSRLCADIVPDQSLSLFRRKFVSVAHGISMIRLEIHESTHQQLQRCTPKPSSPLSPYFPTMFSPKLFSAHTSSTDMAIVKPSLSPQLSSLPWVTTRSISQANTSVNAILHPTPLVCRSRGSAQMMSYRARSK